ncbi:hypothetical protein HYC85_005553 [Camellia sinensis]|uniref:Uncharacterized protein n=1 Tax=Camellia sinensis TaxID=4442 RepID=A0A7J7I2H1_CAMSI|nr:hypothetical protein HYC85_005553 [Camellia sinensis]
MKYYIDKEELGAKKKLQAPVGEESTKESKRKDKQIDKLVYKLELRSQTGR